MNLMPCGHCASFPSASWSSTVHFCRLPLTAQ